MAKFTWTVETAGRPVPGATVAFYDENAARTSFGDKDKATIYSDRLMTVETDNPQVADSHGEVSVYIPSMTLLAIKTSRAGYGERLDREEEVKGSDAT